MQVGLIIYTHINTKRINSTIIHSIHKQYILYKQYTLPVVCPCHRPGTLTASLLLYTVQRLYSVYAARGRIPYSKEVGNEVESKGESRGKMSVRLCNMGVCKGRNKAREYNEYHIT